MSELILNSSQDLSLLLPGQENNISASINIFHYLDVTDFSCNTSLLSTVETSQALHNIVATPLSWDNILGWQPAVTLQEFAQSPDFQSQIHLVFGDNFNAGRLQDIHSQWLVGNLTALPQIEVLNSSVFPTGTLGAFSGETNKIYLNEELLSGGNTELIKEAIIEETGHWLDKEINSTDTPGDEGELLAAFVTGKQLNPSQIADIKNQDDTTTIFVDGKSLIVEQSTVPTITITASDASAAETVTGQTTNPGRFTLSRAGDLTSALTVNYTVVGTAVNGTDYTSLPGNVSFAAGASTAVVNVTPIDNTTSEATETVTLNLATGTGYSLGTTKTATVNIADNDIPVITIAATYATAGETITGQTANPGRFTLTRIGNLASALTVNYTVVGTAVNGTDYTSLPGNVSFAAGASTAVVNVTPIDNTTSEATETVTLNLATGTGYSLGTTKTATVNIADNDIPVITIAATYATAGETITGQTANPGRFTLTRIGNLASALTVNYTVVGTAVNGTDYTSLPGNVSFAAGASTAVVNVTPVDDTTSEATETVTLNLATGTGYSLGTTKTATVNIADNDIPVITIAATDATAGETITGQTANPGRFTLTRIGNLASALTVNYTVVGTAVNGTDYTSLPGNVSFAAGASTAVVNVTPVDDTGFEGDETVIGL
ncbi:Calx-beta domain-containing protein [Sphaerospermopsis sp. FACHB-1194]|uniref:beta strand repeat-containing protein n=1 Tax=Sphaerospermopsis sp. FACHB-1194 TaxID=2692862 RepID=UPI001680A96D|nr:Calx-beta domain-containing protein [Sphaerospermopsis sp. FACHB-1194]MBD2144906.1 hypothetical protein [Sphaerospermopsis sp. FACHB-1194]